MHVLIPHELHDYIVTRIARQVFAHSERRTDAARADNGHMTGKELDPQRARAARDVVRQHPAMVGLLVGAPAIAAVALVWWLLGPGTAIVLLIAAVLVGGWSILRKR
jgi:hypothetical protein